MSSGSTGGRGGGDAKTIISPNTSFGDIIMPEVENQGLQCTHTRYNNTRFIHFKYRLVNLMSIPQIHTN